MQHLIDMNDLSVAEIQALIETAQDIIAAPEKYRQKCVGRILATLFFEPSTRTRLSFESAMQSLGGSTLGFASADTSSATKGETVADTIRVVSAYADICAMRHPKEGSALVAAQFATIPVINGGDGGNQHPTQTLTDLLTIHNKKGRLDNLCIGICGDLKFGRTVHSLVKSLTKYTGNRYILVSPEELKVPGYIREDVLKAGSHDYVETQDLESNIADMDILYMTRVQRERFFNEEDYIRLKDRYILDKDKLNSAKADLSVMHPLPRVNEIAGEIDQDPRAHYFDQVRYGRYIRMALIMKLLEVA